MRPKTKNFFENRVAFFGGVYSNYLALQALLEDAHRRGVKEIYCLGDLGAFGPFPDKVCHVLRERRIPVVQGNYDHSIGSDLADCQCGYTDPRDNYFAKLSYDYTFRNTSAANKAWMRTLPGELRIQLGPYRVLLCHGSPRRTNEFLWETTTSDAFLNWLFQKYQADIIVGTHTGLPWSRILQRAAANDSERQRMLASTDNRNYFINCGAIGRPPNDGKTTVVYTILSAGSAKTPIRPHAGTSSCTGDEAQNGRSNTRNPILHLEFVRLSYDHEMLAREMRSEGLPAEFIETIQTGWWTTCNEILPAKERARGIY